MAKKRDPWKRIVANLKDNRYAKDDRSKEITITAEDVEAQFLRQKGRCYWLGVPIDPNTLFQSWDHLAPSLDRLDPRRGYVPDNVVVTTRFANLGRGRLTISRAKDQVRKLRKLIANDMWPVFPFDDPAATPREAAMWPEPEQPKLGI